MGGGLLWAAGNPKGRAPCCPLLSALLSYPQVSGCQPCCCSALLVFTAVPWTLCALLFSGLHLTYPRDRDRAAATAAAAEAAEAASLVPAEADGEPAGLELVAVGSDEGLSEGDLTEEDKAASLADAPGSGSRSGGSAFGSNGEARQGGH